MPTLDQILEELHAEASALASVEKLIVGLESQVKTALSGASIPAAVQAKIDEVFVAAKTNSQAIAEALASAPGALTPAADSAHSADATAAAAAPPP